MTADGPLLQAAADLHNAGRVKEAIAVYRELAKGTLTVTLARNLGQSLYEIGQHAEAETWLGLAARNRAGDPGLRIALGWLYSAQGRIDLAELEFRTALALKPDDVAATLGLASLYLSVGRYREGWPLMEARTDLPGALIPAGPPSIPPWRGEAVAGKTILVCPEQGFGDHIQMARFAATLKARGAARVTLSCRPPLAALLAQVDGVDAVISLPPGEAVSVGAHDYWTRYFSLPHHLGVTLEALPSAPYVTAPVDRRATWAGWSGVGICWQVSATGANARNKALPPDQAQRLLDLGAVSLHPEDTGAKDFADTAAILEQLDLVISVDTAVAHLAGAMGKPCWTLAPGRLTDWRWGRAGDTSPWYPSMRLYRQAPSEDWSRVVDQVAADLAALRRT